MIQETSSVRSPSPYQPVRWLGGASNGGLMLPEAQPKPHTLYAPRGVYVDVERELIVVADSGNHRILIWHRWPEYDHAPADIVLGQAGFYDEGPKLLHLPTAVSVIQGMLVVADAWHHRLLVWDTVPIVNNALPDYVIGQNDLNEHLPNRGTSPGPAGFYWPYGFCADEHFFYVADTGNRRVLVYKGLPLSDEKPDFVLGQKDFQTTLENRGEGVGPRSFRWPHAITCDDTYVWIADAGNHRILGFKKPLSMDQEATLCIGQDTFYENYELPHVPQGPARLRFPYGVIRTTDELVVADTANNRILVFEEKAWLDRSESSLNNMQLSASFVLGQDDFSASGENRWGRVDHDSFCWPYGIWADQDWLAVADSGNNRVTLWQRM